MRKRPGFSRKKKGSIGRVCPSWGGEKVGQLGGGGGERRNEGNQERENLGGSLKHRERGGAPEFYLKGGGRKKLRKTEKRTEIEAKRRKIK